MKTLWLCVVALMAAAGCASTPRQTASATEAAPPLPKHITLDLGGAVALELALVPAGSFTMGSPAGEQDRDPDEGPRHEVTITRPFYMGRYEVTQQQYEAVMGANPSRVKASNHPVDGIWFEDAVAFCRRLSQQTGKRVRLPTEAEWEYACRAGTQTRFSFGDDYASLPRYGNFNRKIGPAGISWPIDDPGGEAGSAVPVGSYKPNAWGLYDMHGNVFEWCADWYRHQYPTGPRTDPVGPPSGPYRVLRGGSWQSPAWLCRSAYRHRFTANGQFNYLIGFRVVVEVE